MAWLDRLGLTASIGCAIHCLATGIFFLLVPGLLEYSHDSSHWLHAVLAVVIIPVALFSIGRGYRMHRKWATLFLGGLGLGLLTIGLLFHPTMAETLLTFLGGILLALAHFINLKGIQRYSKVASTGQ